MSLQTPLAKVKGLGSAKDGTHHWWHQRLSAIALLPLSLWFIYSVVSMVGADYMTVVYWIRLPYVTVLLILFLVALFYHALLGMQIVVEDYIHSEWQKIACLILVKFLAAVGALASVLSVLNVFFGFNA
ncbi:MAG: succinate dehydrogenase, hydrophobic membrane anchor protein [Gammaproteobacteria bacterium]|nr:succinate dehydrogenase, hydrophobic membrane anchor protein [Gammaproteobacteria bacterium]